MSILKPKQPRLPGPRIPLPQFKRNRKPAPPTWALFFIAIILGIAVVTFIGQQANSARVEASIPLGPTLPSFAGTPIMAGALQPLVLSTEGDPQAQLAIATPPPLPPGAPICNGPRELKLLLVGLDNEANYENTLADSIRVVRFDFVEPSISIITIPRDTWVAIPDLPSGAAKNLSGFLGKVVDADGNEVFPPGDYGKINVSYFYGNLYDLKGGGATLLAKTIYLNFGIQSDNYLLMNMDTFVDVVDGMNGLDIDVPRDLNDPEKGWFFKAGLQHFDGEQTLQYARIRHPDSDWQRTDRQTQIIMAVRDKMLQPENWKNVPSIVNQFIDNIRTDLSREQIAAILCMASQTPKQGIRTYEFGQTMNTVTHTNTGVYALLVNPVAAGNEVYRFLYGGVPTK